MGSSHNRLEVRIFGPPQYPIIPNWFVTHLLSLSVAPPAWERIMFSLNSQLPVILLAGKKGGWLVQTYNKAPPWNVLVWAGSSGYLGSLFLFFFFIVPSTIPTAGDFSLAVVSGGGENANQYQWVSLGLWAPGCLKSTSAFCCSSVLLPPGPNRCGPHPGSYLCMVNARTGECLCVLSSDNFWLRKDFC